MSTTMSDYLLLYRIDPAAQRERMGTPEEMQSSMQAWLAWMRDLEANGHLKDGGQPLEPGGSVVRGRQRAVTDGPYIESKDLVAGYTVISARDLAHAAELAAGCPILHGDGSVEIRPIAILPS